MIWVYLDPNTNQGGSCIHEPFLVIKMQNGTPGVNKIARRILEVESASNKRSGSSPPHDFTVFKPLRERFVKLAGIGGWCALLVRALALAADDVPWLRMLEINSDGTFTGLDEVRTKVDPGKIARGEVALTEHLLGLLVTFIGPSLTLQLVKDIWPGLDNLNFDPE